MNRYKHPPASDFRERLMGADYFGPSDKTIMNHISMFGTRKQCSQKELIRQFSEGHASWKETTRHQLARMVKEKKIIVVEGDETWYRVVNNLNQ